MPPRARPYQFAAADYEPNGRAARAAGTRYKAIAAGECKGGKWKPRTPLASGLFYVPCGVQISGS